MASERTAVLRPPTPAEQLARLHPIERLLLRVFEFLSSIRLAIAMMIWLMLECMAGGLIEAAVNTPAAWYLVYGNTRFQIMLGLLALNILSAAMIRFPWKRYQTGFVVTHIGLLILLFGSWLTLRDHLDALMVVKKDQASNRIFDSHKEAIEVTIQDMDGRPVLTQTIPVDLGPFTWGHKMFGVIPWRRGYTEEHKLKNGDIIRIKQFYANCDREDVYVETEPVALGLPALRYRLHNPQFGNIADQWTVLDDELGEKPVGGGNMRLGTMHWWRVRTTAEFDHFVQGVPEKLLGLLGTLVYSHGGTHHRFKVDDVKKSPATIPGTSDTIEVAEYLPSAGPGNKDKLFINRGDEPNNPALRVTLTRAGTAKDYWVLALPQLNAHLVKRQGTDDLFSYYPVDQRAEIHLALGPDNRLGYRAFGSHGLIAATEIAPGQTAPGWAVPQLQQTLQFTLDKFVLNGRPDAKLWPRPLKKGKDGSRGAVVEYLAKGGAVTTALFRVPGLVMGGETSRIVLGDQVVQIRLNHWESTVPFEIRLDDYREPKIPGTQNAAMFTSIVTLKDEKNKVNEKKTITMNEPLRYTVDHEYALYQSSISRDRDGLPVSTFTVAYDPGLMAKYVGAVTLSAGIFLMFYMGGYFKRPRRAVMASDIEERDTGGVADPNLNGVAAKREAMVSKKS